MFDSNRPTKRESLNRNCRNLVVLTTLLFASAAPLLADRLYFADVFYPTFDDGTIRSANADGSDVQDVYVVGGGLRGIAVDSAGGKVYYTDVNNFLIGRVNLDGSNPEPVITSGLAFPRAVAFDGSNSRIYWGDQSNEEIGRSNLDGSGQETAVPGTPFYAGLAYDPAGDYLYWSVSLTASTGEIRRGHPLSGSYQVIVPTAANFKPGPIALDVPGGKIYWADSVNNTVRRANIAGGGMETLYFDSFGLSPRGIAIDPAHSKVYVGQDTDFESNAGKIVEIDLVNQTFHDIIIGIGRANDIAFVPGSAACTPCDANCDGSVNQFDIQPFVDALSGSPSNCSPCAADANSDGTVNQFDIQNFVECLGS